MNGSKFAKVLPQSTKQNLCERSGVPSQSEFVYWAIMRLDEDRGYPGDDEVAREGIDRMARLIRAKWTDAEMSSRVVGPAESVPFMVPVVRCEDFGEGEAA